MEFSVDIYTKHRSCKRIAQSEIYEFVFLFFSQQFIMEEEFQEFNEHPRVQ